MKKFGGIFELNADGLKLFQRIMLGQADEGVLNPTDPKFTKPILGSKPLAVSSCETAKQLAVEVCLAFGELDPWDYANRPGVWAWLYFAYLDVVSPKMKNGKRKVLEFVRWFPSDPNDYQKAQRHLVRMPVLLYSTLKDDADHLLCGAAHSGPEIREQLTSQQDMFSANFQRACRSLYFDEQLGKLKRGVGGRDTAGSSRRMAQVRKQLDVTWDMTDLASERILELLPSEFDAFRLSKAP